MFKLTRKLFYIILFAILWLITAFSSFFHAVEFFELSNVTWMGIILALAFEIGQASVLMSILTSKNDRKKYTPWILMGILTIVQIIGNVYSSYKYIMINSPENLRYFKEPIFIWTDLPDAEATVIITYVSAAILPIVALLMTAMITNYLTDNEVENNLPILSTEINSEKGPNPPIDIKNKEDFVNNFIGEKEDENPLINQNSMLHMENQGLQESNKKKDEEIEQLRKQIEELNNKKDGESGEITTKESESNNDDGRQQMGTDENQTPTESPITENIKPEINEIPNETTGENSIKTDGSETKLEGDKSEDGGYDLKEEIPHKPSVKIKEDVNKQPSHFINL